eukprot:COSAG01_NODE_461_length_16698_cov_113.458160_19_plen_47_part_00
MFGLYHGVVASLVPEQLLPTPGDGGEGLNAAGAEAFVAAVSRVMAC